MPEEIEAGLAVPDQKLPKELVEKLKAAKAKLDKFKSALLKRYEKPVKAIALLPPPKLEKPEEQEKLFTLVLYDDSALELPKSDFEGEIEKVAKEIDQAISPQLLGLAELWQNCFDGKWEILRPLALSAPVYDTGLLAAIKISEIHKTMILQKFEKYIVCYVLAGSIVQGKATKESDIDVFVVVDDTDVKRMTRVELKDKLRAIIIGSAIEAGELTGIRNKLNIQTYILTEFWESIREANPVIFTFLRDGVPLYDRGIFMPWKQLLKMGKIRPSMEAIDMYMSIGDQAIERVKSKLKDLGMEDLFWATITPSQAALMMYGIPPPTPKETPELLREIFVKKEKLLEEGDIAILEKIIETRKAIEYGTKKEISGKEIDALLEGAVKYLKRVRALFAQLERLKSEQAVLQALDSAVSAVRDALRAEGLEEVPEEQLLQAFERKLVLPGKFPPGLLRSLKELLAIRAGAKLTKVDAEKARKLASELVSAALEHVQRKRIKELEAARIRLKVGQRFGEVLLLGNTAFICPDIDAEPRQYKKAAIGLDGSLLELQDSSAEELEATMAKVLPRKAVLSPQLYSSLQRIFGKEFDILM